LFFLPYLSWGVLFKPTPFSARTLILPPPPPHFAQSLPLLLESETFETQRFCLFSPPAFFPAFFDQFSLALQFLPTSGDGAFLQGFSRPNSPAVFPLHGNSASGRLPLKWRVVPATEMKFFPPPSIDSPLPISTFFTHVPRRSKDNFLFSFPVSFSGAPLFSKNFLSFHPGPSCVQRLLPHEGSLLDTSPFQSE